MCVFPRQKLNVIGGRSCASAFTSLTYSMASTHEAVSSKRARVYAPSSGIEAAQHPYGFPFPPYGCQLELMRELYACLDRGGVGVFESPTGTGKSLSLVCGALQWQRDQQNKEEERLAAEPLADDDDELSWISEWASAKELAKVQARSSAASEARERRARRLERYMSGARLREHRAKSGPEAAVAARAAGAASMNLDEFTLAEWEEDQIGTCADGTKKVRIELEESSSESDDDGDASRPWRILYCSRTHSQLAQVVGEVRKTVYGRQVSVVSLGSRKALCTNEAVRSLGGSERVNEACLDLQGKKSKGDGDEQGGRGKSTGKTAVAKGGSGGCPYHQPRSEEQREARQAVSDRLLLEPLDVEELASLGRREGCCAYYSSRASLPEAQLVLLPYASLLHAGTRGALGISLKRSVVIIDEAHNLVDTINETHSVTLTARQLSEVSAQLAQYAERYHSRLHPSNRLCVQQLLQVVRALRTSLLPPAQPAVPPTTSAPSASAPSAPAAPTAPAASSATERIVAMNDFLCGLNVDHLNLFRLQTFCEGSQIAKKLRGFAESQSQTAVQAGKGDASSARSAPAGSLHSIVRVLEALTNEDKDGCVRFGSRARHTSSPHSTDTSHGAPTRSPSPLTPHPTPLLLTPHLSPLTTHPYSSPLTPHPSPLTTHRPPLTAHPSQARPAPHRASSWLCDACASRPAQRQCRRRQRRRYPRPRRGEWGGWCRRRCRDVGRRRLIPQSAPPQPCCLLLARPL